MEKKIVEEGVVAEFEGKYWGIQYEDGQSQSNDFGPIEKAHISNPKFCKRPEDMTYERDPDISRLANAKLVKVRKTTVFKIISP